MQEFEINQISSDPPMFLAVNFVAKDAVVILTKGHKATRLDAASQLSLDFDASCSCKMGPLVVSRFI